MSSLLSCEALHKLEEQLTCSICMCRYNDPRALPCFHSFCLDCLKGVLLAGTDSSLPCPTCRSHCEIPEQEGVEALPTSFTINNLTEVYSTLKKGLEGHTSCDKCKKKDGDRYCKQCASFLCWKCLISHDKQTNNHETLDLNKVVNETDRLPKTVATPKINCPKHDSQPIKIYCKTCTEFTCSMCMETNHKDHDYEIVDDVYARYRFAVQQSSLQQLNRLISVMSESVANLAKRRKEIAEQGESVKDEVHEMKGRLEEDNIDKEVSRIVEYKLSVTNQQIQEGEAMLGQIAEWRDHMMQGNLSVVTPQQILSTKTQVSRNSSLLSTITKSLKPIEQADLRFVRNDIDDDMPLGRIEYSIEAKPIITTSFDHVPKMGEVSTINLSLSLEDGFPVSSCIMSCHLNPPTSPSSPIQCRVKRTSQTGQYRVVFTPHTGGSHQLHVNLQDRTISASIPVIFPIKIQPHILEMIGDDSYGVALCDDGRMVVCCSDDHRLFVATKDGEMVKSFGTLGRKRGEFLCPEGIAVTSRETILVADCENHRLQELTMDGDCISCIGREGDGPLEFLFPCGVAINKTTGQVYVTDLSNCRVQVLNADLTFSFTFGSYGSGNGQFKRPCGIAIDSQGFVYVADNDLVLVQKFTPEGQFVSSFLSKGSEPNNFLFITIDRDLLYINFWEYFARGPCMSVYTTNGEHVHCYENLMDASILHFGYVNLLNKTPPQNIDSN